MALSLDSAKVNILSFVESRMSVVAPNLSALVDTGVAAKMMAAAGGLEPLSKLHANMIGRLGSKKRALAGLSVTAGNAAAVGTSAAPARSMPSCYPLCVDLLCTLV